MDEDFAYKRPALVCKENWKISNSFKLSCAVKNEKRNGGCTISVGLLVSTYARGLFARKLSPFFGNSYFTKAVRIYNTSCNLSV